MSSFYKEKNTEYLINYFVETYNDNKDKYYKNKNTMKHVLRHEASREIVAWSLESEYGYENDSVICELFLKPDGKAFLNLLQHIEVYLEDH